MTLFESRETGFNLLLLPSHVRLGFPVFRLSRHNQIFVHTDFHVRKRHFEVLEQGKKMARIVRNYPPPVPAGTLERSGLCHLDANKSTAIVSANVSIAWNEPSEHIPLASYIPYRPPAIWLTAENGRLP